MKRKPRPLLYLPQRLHNIYNWECTKRSTKPLLQNPNMILLVRGEQNPVWTTPHEGKVTRSHDSFPDAS